MSDVDGYEVNVTVDLAGMNDLKQVILEASNEIGSFSVQLLCPSGPGAVSCSFFNMFNCPNSSPYSQVALTVGLVLLLVLILLAFIVCLHLARSVACNLLKVCDCY